MKIVSNVLFAITAAIFMEPSVAIYNGVPDGDLDNAQYPSVGAIVFRDDSDPTEWYPDCTGTLVAEDKVLTAAHCVDLDPIDGLPKLGRIYFSVRSNPVAPDLSSCNNCIDIVQVDLDPRWDPVFNFAAADTGDLAIVHLKKKVKGVDMLGFGSLSNPAPAQGELFTVVGYGASEDPDGTPVSFQYEEIRQITDDHKFQNLNNVYLTTSQAGAENYGGTCFGDSGAAILRTETDGTKSIVAVASEGPRQCVSMTKNYRTDTVKSQAFINSVLGN